MMTQAPKEFAAAMRELVERSQRSPATAVSAQAYEMKLKILDYLIEREPDARAFEQMLLDRIADPDHRKELSRGVCCQIMNSWRSGSMHYDRDGKLTLRALYPADYPRAGGPEDE